MEDDDKNKWRRFQRPQFDSKHVAKRARKAETATIRHARKFITKRLDNIQEVRRLVAFWLAGIAILILAVGAQLMWFQNSYTTQTGASDGTYAEATLGPINTLNPLYASSSAEISASRLIFSSLFSYDTTGHLNGDLVKTMTTSADGTSYTVNLRSDVKWHDDATLTAKDVLFTVNLIKNPEARSSLRTQWQDVSLKLINDTTLEFKLPSVYAAFPHALTFPILPEHKLKDVAPSALRENSFSLSPIGSGPFEYRLAQTSEDHKIVNLSAVEHYYKGVPTLGRCELHAYSKQDNIISALRTGQVNAAADLSDVSVASSMKNYVVHYAPVNDGVYAFFNTAQPALKDVKVRQALQQSLDVGAIRKTLGGGKTPLDLPFVNGQLKVDDTLPKASALNIKNANSLLDQAGWKREGTERKKDGQPLILSVVTTKNAQYQKIIDGMKKDWAPLGVKLQTTVVDTSDPTQDFTQNILQPRAYDVLVYELSIGADPDVYAFWHSSQVGQRGLNLSVYTSGVADDALTSARARSEPELRDIKYKAFARQWLNDVPAIGLYQSSLQYVESKQVTALEDEQKLVSPYDRYSSILYWTAGRASVYKTP